MQYVPIIETLKLIMSHDDIRQYITSEKSSDDNWLISFRDGNTLLILYTYDFKKNINLSAVSRTKESYDNQVRNIKEKINLKDIENAKKESGIKENSPVHASRYFHCTQNLVFDPMHDTFEGIAWN